jgi:hypothetical protein
LLDGGVHQSFEINPRQHDAQHMPWVEHQSFGREAADPTDHDSGELIDTDDRGTGCLSDLGR